MEDTDITLTIDIGGEPFKTAAKMDRDSGLGLIEIKTLQGPPVVLTFANTNAALALTEAMLHLSQEMLKNDTSSNSPQPVGEYCIVGDDTAQLVKSVLGGHTSRCG